MGALGFNPYEWVEREDVATAKVAKVANEWPDPPQSFAGFATFAVGELPRAVIEGLSSLPVSRPPRRVRCEGWAAIAKDALRLRDDGWGAKALALGWSPLHLWGWSIDREGLAVMLDGRRIVVMDADWAMIDNGPQSTALYNVRPMPDDAILLWELGR